MDTICGEEAGMKNRLVIRAGLDGLIRAFLLFFIIDIQTSTLLVSLNLTVDCLFIVVVIIPASLAFLLSTGLAVLNFKKTHTDFGYGKYLLLGTAFFLFSSFLLVFINNLTVHFRIFPLRQMSNADGLLIILTCGCYLLAGLIGRIVAFPIIKKLQSKKWG